jgi:uncharacterized coiled-coil DUF342 family protein
MNKEDVIHGLKTLAKQERKAQSLLTGPREAPQEFERWYIAEVLEAALLIIEQRDRLAEELNELKEEYGTWWAQKRIAIDELKDVTEQRDRLAEALREIANCDFVITLPDRMDAVRAIAREALAAVKGGSDE